MQRLFIIIFIIYVGTASYCTRHIPSVESSFYTDVMREHPNTNGLICRNEMTGSCKKLFLRPHYRYEIKVHLNNRAYDKFSRSNIPLCEKHRITFRAKPEKFPKDRFEEMYPCFGRHSTIRTDYEVDDYLKKFYLAYFPKKKTYYVFQAERHGTPEVQFTFYEQILDDSWQRFASTVSDYIDGGEFLRELVLNTIEMHNYWPHEIENIFVNEMISNETPKLNQLANLKAPTLLVLCASVLRNSLIPDETFSLDFIKMESWNPQPQKIKLYFDFETQFNDWPHEGYPCYGKHSRNIPSQNRKYLNMFLLSSGPHKDTLFLFSYLSNENHYMIVSFIANVKFNNFYLTKSIFEKYKPNLSGPPAAPGPIEPSAPPVPPGPHELFRPGVPPTPQINLMPLAPPEHYPLPNPSAQYELPMHPTPSGQFPFPAPSTTSAPPTFFMPSEPSARYTFPSYQAAPAAPSESSVPSSSHTLPGPSGSSASDKSEDFKPSNT